MGRAPVQQFSFTSGMLDDSLEARSDLASYYSGGREILNMLILPQGGLYTRSGLAFISEQPEAFAGARLARFEFSPAQRYLHVFTHRKLHVYYQDKPVATIATPWTTQQLAQIDWAQSLDTMIVVHPDVPPQKIMRAGAHNSWSCGPLTLKNVPKHTFAGTRKEAAWSDARGWPRSVCLYQGRMYFGGSKGRPQTIWGSSSNHFFDFRVTSGQPLDDDSVEMTLDSDQIATFEQLYPRAGLLAFTTSGLFFQKESPVTPKNFIFSRHVNLPAARIKPVELEGEILFVRRGEDGHHQSVHELVFDEGRQIYTTQDIALLSSRLMRAPIRMAARYGDESQSNHHLYIVNGRDGTLAVFNSRRKQNVSGWSLLQTAGKFKDIAVLGTHVYFLVERTINNKRKVFIEKMDPEHRLDFSIRQTSKTAKTDWSGLSHLSGMTVHVMGNGVDMGVQSVEDGQIRTPHPVNDMQAGLAFDWAVETMPLAAKLADGSLVAARHRIVQAGIYVQDTITLKVNGRAVSFARLDKPGILDAPPTPFTGLKTVRFFGWSGGAHSRGGGTVRLTGTSTGPATILSITAEVS
ncbi:MAG: hypothetical protein AAF442_06235 [Pseudomonadota bacterium]